MAKPVGNCDADYSQAEYATCMKMFTKASYHLLEFSKCMRVWKRDTKHSEVTHVKDKITWASGFNFSLSHGEIAAQGTAWKIASKIQWLDNLS